MNFGSGNGHSVFFFHISQQLTRAQTIYIRHQAMSDSAAPDGTRRYAEAAVVRATSGGATTTLYGLLKKTLATVTVVDTPAGIHTKRAACDASTS